MPTFGSSGAKPKPLSPGTGRLAASVFNRSRVDRASRSSRVTINTSSGASRSITRRSCARSALSPCAISRNTLPAPCFRRALDTDFIGYPTVGDALSNGIGAVISRPRFSDAAFAVGPTKTPTCRFASNIDRPTQKPRVVSALGAPIAVAGRSAGCRPVPSNRARSKGTTTSFTAPAYKKFESSPLQRGVRERSVPERQTISK